MKIWRKKVFCSDIRHILHSCDSLFAVDPAGTKWFKNEDFYVLLSKVPGLFGGLKASPGDCKSLKLDLTRHIPVLQRFYETLTSFS